MTMVRGNRQSGTIGEPLADSLVVKVLDRFNDPVSGLEITWTPEVGGSVNPTTSVTGADGQAATERVLGAEVGTYVTTATIAGLESGPDPVVFVTTGVAARLVLSVAPPAAAVAGVPLDPQPVLQLQDPEGNPLARDGVIVTAAIGAGGGTLEGATSVPSDANGQAAFPDLTLRGSPGTRQLIFAAEGFASAMATVALGVGSPAAIEAAASTDQSATAGMPVAASPAVLVRDQDGNPLAGIPVTFKVRQGGGSLGGTTPVTGADGVATIGRWTLGQKAGANSVEATLSGLEVTGSPVVFTATGTPGPVDAGESSVTAEPASITASGGSSRSTITVRALDQFDNPIADAAVTLSATGQGAQLRQPGPTGSDGSTTGELSATTPGDHVVSASIAGTAVGQTVTITVTAGVPSAGRSTATVPGGQAGQATSITIRLKDAQGNDVPGQPGAISVSITGPNAGTTITRSDEGGGAYVARYTPTRTGTDQVQVRVSGSPLSGSPFGSAVLAGPADAKRSTADVPGCVEFNRLPATVRITAVDAFGNRRTRGGDSFRISVNQGQALQPEDHGDGTYTRDLNLAVGVFRIDITLNGTPIGGNPFQIFVPFPFSGCQGDGDDD